MDIVDAEEKFVGGIERDRAKDVHVTVSGIPLLRVKNSLISNENEGDVLEKIVDYVQIQMCDENGSAVSGSSRTGVKYLRIDADSRHLTIAPSSDDYEKAMCLYKKLKRFRQRKLDFFYAFE